MKKLGLISIILLMLMVATPSYAAEDCTVSVGNWTDLTAEIVWECTCGAADAAINNTSAGKYSSWFKKYPYTLSIVIENLAADTNVTDDSDIYLYDKSSGGADLLEGDGVDQLDDSSRNFVRLTPNPLPQQVWMGMENNAVNSGEFKIVLTIAK